MITLWRRRPWLLAAIAVLAVVVAAVAGVPVVRGEVLRAAGRMLVVDEPVESADMIVVPEWAGAAGVIDASDLFHRGHVGGVALLPGPSTAAERELARRGVPYVDENESLVRLFRSLGVANVEVIADPAAGTEAEGDVLLTWSKKRQIHSIIVVSSPDHSRRLRRVLHRALRNSLMKVIVRSAHFPSFDPDNWWRTRGGLRTEIVESQKLLLDFVRHPIS